MSFQTDAGIYTILQWYVRTQVRLSLVVAKCYIICRCPGEAPISYAVVWAVTFSEPHPIIREERLIEKKFNFSFTERACVTRLIVVLVDCNILLSKNTAQQINYKPFENVQKR